MEKIKPLTVGEHIDARCTKCRAITNHTLVALVDEKPARVKCNTCSGEHAYRPPAKAKSKSTTAKPKKATGGRTKVDPREVERQEWTALRPTMDSSKALDYTMDAKFKAKNLVKHPVFGLGLVQQVVGPNKVLILFQDGKKIMRCA